MVCPLLLLLLLLHPQSAAPSPAPEFTVALALLDDNPPVAVNLTVPHDGDPATSLGDLVLLQLASTDAPYDKLRFGWACPWGQSIVNSKFQPMSCTPGFVGPGRDENLPCLPSAHGFATKGDRLHLSLPVGRFVCNASLQGFYEMATKSVVVDVLPEENAAPVASWQLGAPTTFDTPHTGAATVALLGNASDPDGDAWWASWDCGLGKLDGVSVNTSDLGPGEHSCVLSVTDSYNATSTLAVPINVTAAPNFQPTVDPGPDQNMTVLHDGDPLTSSAFVLLNGTVADLDLDDSLVSSWSCSSGPNLTATAAGAFVTVTLPAGTHTCTLETVDPLGAIGSGNMTVVVNPEPNQHPVADAGAGQKVENTTEVILNGTASYDADHDELKFRWDCGGPTLQAVFPVVSLMFPECNSTSCLHTCELTVTDSYAALSTDDVVIEIA